VSTPGQRVRAALAGRRQWLQTAGAVLARGAVGGLGAATAAATAALPVAGSSSSTADQLLVGLSMNNLLSLDPGAATGLDAMAVACNLYDGLLETDAQDAAQLKPGLAQAWQVSQGGRRLELNLREGLRFNSGQPVRAEHAAWSLQRVLRLNLAPATVWKSYGFSAAQVASQVQAVGPHTVQIDLPQPTDPQLVLMTLATSMSALVLDRDTVLAHEQRGDLGAAWLTTNAAGSGPFALQRWRPKELLILQRQPGHWRGDARLRRVVMRHMTESQTLRLMLSRNDLDVASGLSPPDIRALAQRADLLVETVRRSNVYYVALNARHPRFADERVRRAVLRHLIDGDGMANSVLAYHGQPHQRPVPPGLAASLPSPGYRLDVAQARSLLAEAGLAQGFDTTIRVLAEAPFTGIATSLQATLAQAGIRASILPGTGNQVYGSMRERQFEIVVGRGGGGAEAHPHSSLRALVYNPDNRDSARLSNFQGWRTGHADAALNALIEQALVEPDAERQTALYRQAQQRVHEVVGGLQPIALVSDTQVMRRDVKGYVSHPSGATRLREVYKVVRA
jgi:peptide/nickel transport system substrate-binding protein